MSLVLNIILILIVSIFVLVGFKVVRPTHRAVVETFGKYTSFKGSGLKWIIPIVQKMIRVNVTERLADVEARDLITKDNLNIKADLQVYYKIKPLEDQIKKALYNVNDVNYQIIQIAQTSARNVIGEMVFRDVNSKRNSLNDKLSKILKTETGSWGIEIVRVELKEITPPGDVQETMNTIIKAENEKDAAKDFATATETEADGSKRAAIKKAEGIARGKRIVADANAYKIEKENKAAKKFFVGNAQKLKQLEVAQNSLEKNSKIILGKDSKDILKLFNIGK